MLNGIQTIESTLTSDDDSFHCLLQCMKENKIVLLGKRSALLGNESVLLVADEELPIMTIVTTPSLYTYLPHQFQQLQWRFNKTQKLKTESLLNDIPFTNYHPLETNAHSLRKSEEFNQFIDKILKMQSL
ncbi:hypothetical protein QTN25_008173 [Entamoeba marina]